MKQVVEQAALWQNEGAGGMRSMSSSLKSLSKWLNDSMMKRRGRNQRGGSVASRNQRRKSTNILNQIFQTEAPT
jgi:hypothetical protein